MARKSKFRIGDRVIYTGGGPDDHSKGTVTKVVGMHFEVHWDDDEIYSYEDWAGSMIRHVA
jgi:hypothetical protein